jgi:hypothetical protein
MPTAYGHGSMYVDNGSVDGLAQQPFRFTVGRPMMLEDSHGKQVRATCVGLVGQSTLWEYETPNDPVTSWAFPRTPPSGRRSHRSARSLRAVAVGGQSAHRY